MAGRDLTVVEHPPHLARFAAGRTGGRPGADGFTGRRHSIKEAQRLSTPARSLVIPRDVLAIAFQQAAGADCSARLRARRLAGVIWAMITWRVGVRIRWSLSRRCPPGGDHYPSACLQVQSYPPNLRAFCVERASPSIPHQQGRKRVAHEGVLLQNTRTIITALRTTRAVSNSGRIYWFAGTQS
jgi:hypothetical protein